ncbi:MAG: carboxypeptidase-like regulatory domain-containing protein [bacterium]
MIRTPLVILVMLSLVLLTVPACSNDDNAVTGPVRPAGTIYGRVLDGSLAQPLENCSVIITSSAFENDTSGTGTVVINTVTDADGAFLRDDVPSGEVDVVVKLGGYRTPTSRIWALSPGGAGQINFEIFPGQDPYVKPDDDGQSARPPDWGKEY